MKAAIPFLIATFLLTTFSFHSIAQSDEEKDQVESELSGAGAEDDETPDGWKMGGLANLSFTNVTLTNWAAGGQNSISVTGLVNLYANYKKGKTTWDNNLDMGYGLVKQGDADFIKNDDKIDFTSKYGRRATKDWYYSGLLNFKSQFDKGYNLPDDSTIISDFLAPAYVLAAVGMDYKPKPFFSLFLSPITAKVTIVNNQTLANAGAFGVEAAETETDTAGNVTIIKEGETVRTEYGGFLRMVFQKDIIENVNLQTRLELFSSYTNNPQNVDVLWETLIGMKVNKYITASIATTLIYDDDIDILVDEESGRKGPRTQFKEVLAIGLSYQF